MELIQEAILSELRRVHNFTMDIREVKEREPSLIGKLIEVWESSVRETHLFLSNDEILSIKNYVPEALRNVEHLIIAEEEEPVAFMGIENGSLEMLFIQYGFDNFHVNKVAVNEQNPQAIGFYEHMGSHTYKRTEHDEQGNPYPLLYMCL